MIVWWLLATLLPVLVLSSPVTTPHLPGGSISDVIPTYFDSKKGRRVYHESVPEYKAEDKESTSHIDKDATCGLDLTVRWSSDVGGPVYGTPVIFPSGPEGKREVFLSTFYDYIEVLGFDGHKPWGWPMTFEDSSFMGSPMLFDIDGDGTNDIGIVDKNGNLYFMRIGEFGQYLEDYHIQVPRLKVKRDWARGINASYVDSEAMLSMFDHKRRGGMDSSKDHSEDMEALGGRPRPAKEDELSGLKPKPGTKGTSQASYPELKPDSAKRKLRELSAVEELEQSRVHSRRLQAEEGGGEGAGDQEMEDPGIPDFGEGSGSLGDDFYGDPESRMGMHDDFSGDPNAAYGERSMYGYGELHGVKGEDDMYFYYGRGGSGAYNESDFVMVDAHVLGSPTLADVNGDGHLEVIMAVSYYFDKIQYEGKTGLDFEPSDYVAGGVVCWDLQAQSWSWTVHLDLTTDRSHFTALIQDSPTVVDLDGDGRSEVIVGTSLGLLYVLDGETGFTRRFFPMQFHQIQCQVAVADIWGGPNLEIIVADMGGNLVALDVDGEVLWDLQLGGTLPFTPTVGDVNGDGRLDVVVVASTKDHGCLVYAVDGQTGKVLKSYPLGLPHKAKVSSSVLLVDLHDYSRHEADAVKSDPSLPPWVHRAVVGKDRVPRAKGPLDGEGGAPDEDGVNLEAVPLDDDGAPTRGRSSQARGLHMVVPSFDGHVYILDAQDACADRVDVGEHIYSMPLVDDVTGDGTLDLLISTFNGQVLVVGTSTPYHPLNSWPSFPKHRLNGFTHGQLGISVPETVRGTLKHADIRGASNLTITFDIWDERRITPGDKRSYSVSITKGTNKLAPIFQETYDLPGRYSVSVKMTPPESVALVVGMINEHGQHFEDVVSVSVSTRFYVWLKYMLLGPLLLLSLPLLMARKRSAA